jgi:hypothetical protein
LRLEVLEDRTVPSVTALSLGTGGIPGVKALSLPSGSIPNVTALSLPTGGGVPNGDAFGAATSADGRYVAYSSKSTNLVSGQVDTNNDYDIFLTDRVAGTTTLVSHAAGLATTTGSAGSFSPVGISSDGRFIVYTSSATDLLPSIGTIGQNIFLFDRTTGLNTLVSHVAGSPTAAGNGDSSEPVISKDGNFIAYASGATNLVAGQTDTNNDTDVFLYNRTTDTTTLVSHAAGSPTTSGDKFSDQPVIDDNGGVVAFRSGATDLVAGESNVDPGGNDVYRFDATAGTNALVSHTAGTPATTGNDFSQGQSVSGDGRFVAYFSAATDLVGGVTDTNGVPDIFLYDATTQANTLVSHTAGSPLVAATGSAATGGSFGPMISDDGSSIAYYSDATSQVAGLTTATPLDNVFAYNRGSDVTILVSHAATSATTSGDQASSLPVISADGQFIAFQSNATDLVSGQQQTTPGVSNIFVFSAAAAGANSLASHAPGSATVTGSADSVVPAISDNGSTTVFQSSATNLVSGSTGGVAQIFTTTPVIGDAFGPVASADGRFVAFSSKSTNLVPGQVDTNNDYDIFLYDQVAGTWTLVSHAAGSATTTGNGGSFSPAGISSDGRFVVYTSSATDLVTGQTGSGENIFVFDRTTGQNTLVSHAAALPMTAGNGDSSEPVISRDGNFIAYASAASNLIAGETRVNQDTDVFLYDRVHDTTTLVSHAAGSPTTSGDKFSDRPVIDDNGGVVAFRSGATDLVAGESNVDPGGNDVYRFDATAGTNALVSHTAGTPTTTGNDFSQGASLSGDGRFVAYFSAATDLVAGATDTNGVPDIFLYDATTQANTLVSHTAGSPLVAATGSAATGGSFGPVISDDGSAIAYYSDATSQVSGLTVATPLNNVFLYNRAGDTTVLVSHAASSATMSGDQASSLPVISANGQVVAYQSNATDLVTGQQQTTAGVSNVFTFNATTGTNDLSSHTPGSHSITGNADSVVPVISDDGLDTIFQSSATNLVSASLGGVAQIFGATNATHFTVTPTVTLIQSLLPIGATVTALDQFGKVDNSYLGTVKLTTSDPGIQVALPPNATFTASDAGIHVFSNIVLQTPGTAQTVTATDTANSSITGTSGPIDIFLAPDKIPQFANVVIQAVLMRAATSSEEDAAVAIIEPALYFALHQTALNLVTSTEARTRLITGYYERFLGRAPTSTELNTALTNLQQGGTPEQLIASILGTDEYFNKVGGTNDAWVNAVYQALLNRAPTSSESSAAITALTSGTMTREQVAAGILATDEYLGDFVTSIYQAYLSRTPSSSEIQIWLPLLRQGSQAPGTPSPDEQFEALVLSSTEFYWKNGNSDIPWLTGVYLVVLGRQPDPTGFNMNLYNTEFTYGFQRYDAALDVLMTTEYRQKVVTGFYQTYLGRSPTPTELTDGVNTLANGGTNEQVQASILGTDEYFNKVGGTNQNWINAVYQALLGRAPTSSESNTANTELTNGTMTREQIAAGILATDEYRTDLINSDYSTYLGRAGDPTGVANALAAMKSGVTDEQILAMVLGSTEYYAKNGLQTSL